MSFGVVISTIKTSVSDLLVQKVVEQRAEVDWKRNAAFATFGCFYLGGVQYLIYVPLFGRLFPNAAQFASKPLREKVKDFKGIRDLLGQVFLDQCVHHPFMYFPAFYCTKELVMQEKPSLPRVLGEYRANMKDDLIALWKVWVPSTLLNFAFMPMWARIPWVAGTSLVWTCILSAMRGGDIQHGQEMAGGAVTGATLKVMTEGWRELFTCPIELDHSLSHICVNASGIDQVGWVAKVAKAVAQNGGNVTHSKMVRMGQDFTILMHVSTPPENLRKLVSGLKHNPELDKLNVNISTLTRRETTKRHNELFLTVHCVGDDKPGMLARVAQYLSDHQISVENLTTELRLTADGTRRQFVITAECVGKERVEGIALEEMLKELSDIKQELKLDVLDIRVHR